MQIAFYKGKGGLFNRLIRWWTGSEITHVELVIDGVWYSSSHYDNGVRATTAINGKSGNWEIYELEGYDKNKALEVFDKVKGSKYDWLGILLSQGIDLGVHNKNRYFCSELVMEMLGFRDGYKYAPHEVLIYVSNKRKLDV